VTKSIYIENDLSEVYFFLKGSKEYNKLLHFFAYRVISNYIQNYALFFEAKELRRSILPFKESR